MSIAYIVFIFLYKLGKNDHIESVRCLANEFSPLTMRQEQYIEETHKVRTDIADLLRDVLPDSCFIQLMDNKKFPSSTKVKCPMSPMNIGRSEAVDSTQMLYLAMALNDEEIQNISKATIEQSYCSEWVEQRKGRITASNIYSVHTKVNTLKRDPFAGTKKLVAKILGQSLKPKHMVAALKHGLALEPHAKRKFKKTSFGDPYTG